MLIEATYRCAYCGSENTIEVDPTGGRRQAYEEDCQTCCRPNVLHIEVWNDGRGADVEARRDDED